MELSKERPGLLGFLKCEGLVMMRRVSAPLVVTGPSHFKSPSFPGLFLYIKPYQSCALKI
jgi:hypothetical protein